VKKEIKTLVTAAGPNMMPVLVGHALPSFERYAAAQGYEVKVEALANDSAARKDEAAKAARRQKIDIIRGALRVSDIALWVDADAIITRKDQDVADELRNDSFQGLVLHNVPTEGNRTNPNTGVWVMRHAGISFDFLDEVEELGQISGRWADQAAVMQVLDWEMGDERHYGAAMPDALNEYTDQTTWLPTGWNQPYMKNRPNPEAYVDRPYVPDPHIVHFMAMTVADRLVYMAEPDLAGRPALLE
jgi:hypothetical protein